MSSSQLQALFEWANSQGLSCPKLRYPVRFEPGYYGSQASADIGPNEAIVTVPRHLLFMASLADSSEFGEIIPAHPELFDPEEHTWSDDFRLISLLLFELQKGTSSFWHCFLDSLPRNIDTLLQWSPEELEELQDSLLVEDVHQKCAEVAGCYDQLRSVLLQYPAFFTDEMVTFERFCWANDIICTRAFGYSMKTNALCPVAELLNHNVVETYYLFAPPDCVAPKTIKEDDEDALPCNSERIWPISYTILAQIVAVTQMVDKTEMLHLAQQSQRLDNEFCALVEASLWKRPLDGDTKNFVFRVLSGSQEYYRAGDELFLCYGAESNRHLLLHYGFSLTKNKYNYEYVFVPVREFLSDAQLACVRGNELTEEWCFKVRERKVCMQLLRTLRLMLWERQSHAVEACFRPCNWDLEKIVLETAVEILQRVLDRYATPISDDELLLRETHDLKFEYALQYRRQRKLAIYTQIALLSALQSVVTRLQGGASLESATAVIASQSHVPLNLPFPEMLAEYLSEVHI